MPRGDGGVLLQRAAGAYTVAYVRDRAGTARAFPEAILIDGGFAVSPPVVNAHTHLDLSSMQFQSSTYSEFISRVIAHRRAGHRGLEAARHGLAEMRALGTQVVGDIVTDPAVMRMLLAEPGLSGVAYWEVFAP